MVHGVLIATTAPEFASEGLHELRDRLHVADERLLGPGLRLLEVDGSFEDAAKKVREDRPVFVRHIQPVHEELEIRNDAAVDLPALHVIAPTLADRLGPGQPFAAQVRMLELMSYRPFDVQQVLQGAGIERDLEVQIKDPPQVINVLVDAGRAYLGTSSTADNLSTWPGGARRYAREPGQISRSEFKLLEAMEAFGVRTESGEEALDLGAAPGGWTRVLVERGAKVHAIDTGELDARMREHRDVSFIRMRAQDVARRSGLPRFSFVVNDLRMDARDSARVMNEMLRILAPSGRAVMTVKLPRSKPVAVLEAAITILRKGYAVQGVRHLFHNRNEVTVSLTW